MLFYVVNLYTFQSLYFRSYGHNKVMGPIKTRKRRDKSRFCFSHNFENFYENLTIFFAKNREFYAFECDNLTLF